VAHRGWASLPDPQLMQRMLAENLTLVTNNWADFAPMLLRSEVHPGMIVILPNVRRAWQMELFRIALASVRRCGSDMVNMVVTVDEAGIIDWAAIPPGSAEVALAEALRSSAAPPSLSPSA
jgi:hypothetical protein